MCVCGRPPNFYVWCGYSVNWSIYGRGSTASFLDELVYFYRQLPSVSRHVFRGSDASKQRETKLYVSPSIESQSSCYVLPFQVTNTKRWVAENHVKRLCRPSFPPTNNFVFSTNPLGFENFEKKATKTQARAYIFNIPLLKMWKKRIDWRWHFQFVCYVPRWAYKRCRRFSISICYSLLLLLLLLLVKKKIFGSYKTGE